ncbi:MAG: hypothetical protein H3C27_07135 [Opitutaceae bacterium]|nr:hypothetical protein [Opitutaceae bacterium]
MSAALNHVTFAGGMLQRGFWLYVWEVTLPDSSNCLYVGRTGDSSSAHAQSPFSRLTQHLSTNVRANALRRHLQNRGIDANDCLAFDLIAYGPILPEVTDMVAHRPSRDCIAALEKALCDALRASGYDVLNTVTSRFQPDPELWQPVLAAFSTRFPKLKP